jgi:selenocysteine lyase/cysteine desulfurase
VRVLGITDPAAFDRRVATVTFVADAVPPDTLARAFAAQGVQVWNGHNYGLEPNRRLGVLETGGGVRVGPVHYNTAEEVDRVVDILGEALHGA